jgi:hypothetical protein
MLLLSSESLFLFRRLLWGVAYSFLCPHFGRRLSSISLRVAAYSRSIPVNKAFPSKCLQRTLFSFSTLSISRFHMAPLPFCCAEVWINCSVFMSHVLIKIISLVASGLLAISVSHACQRKQAPPSIVSHTGWAPPAPYLNVAGQSTAAFHWIPPPRFYEQGEVSLSQLTNTQPVSQVSLISNLTYPANSSYDSLLHTTKTNKMVPLKLHCEIGTVILLP